MNCQAAEDIYESTLPITPEQIATGPWCGAAIKDGRLVMATICASPEHDGYYHCRVIGRDVSETKRPVSAIGVGIMMDSLLSHHGTESKELRWKLDTELSPKRIFGEIVYFLRAGDFVKIGKTTGSPSSRISQLQTGCPFPIEVIATIPGVLKNERALHVRFAHLRAHGEWFHADKSLLSFISDVSAKALS